MWNFCNKCYINFAYYYCFKCSIRYRLKDDVRESLYEEGETWMKAVGKRKFMGGSSPNLADLVIVFSDLSLSLSFFLIFTCITFIFPLIPFPSLPFCFISCFHFLFCFLFWFFLTFYFTLLIFPPFPNFFLPVSIFIPTYFSFIHFPYFLISFFFHLPSILHFFPLLHILFIFFYSYFHSFFISLPLVPIFPCCSFLLCLSDSLYIFLGSVWRPKWSGRTRHVQGFNGKHNHETMVWQGKNSRPETRGS